MRTITVTCFNQIDRGVIQKNPTVLYIAVLVYSLIYLLLVQLIVSASKDQTTSKSQNTKIHIEITTGRCCRNTAVLL